MCRSSKIRCVELPVSLRSPNLPPTSGLAAAAEVLTRPYAKENTPGGRFSLFETPERTSILKGALSAAILYP